MVDISGKEVTARSASAAGTLTCKPETLDAVRARAAPKGAVMSTAELAGIMASKRTAELIPGARYVEIEGMGHDYPPAVWKEWVSTWTSFVADVND